MIVARGVFALFAAGYGKLSCCQLLAFVYDFKQKWNKSYRTEKCRTERNVLLLRMKPFHAHSLVINLWYNIR